MAATEISTVILPLAPSGDFRNEPFVDFKASANEHAMKAALERVSGSKPAASSSHTCRETGIAVTDTAAEADRGQPATAPIHWKGS